MLRTFVKGLSRPLSLKALEKEPFRVAAAFTTEAYDTNPYLQPQVVRTISPEDIPFLHHQKAPRFTDYTKFKSPRKRASKLLHELEKEAIIKSKAFKPAVFQVDHHPGDAIEVELIEEGGVDGKTQKVRGVVIGKYNRGMDTSVLIRDVVMGGTIVERRLPLHSPMVKTIKVIEKNFVYKGRRKIKRAKLYFLRGRNPNESRVTKGKG